MGGYKKRQEANKVRDEAVEYIISLLPKDYSDETKKVLEAVVSSKIGVAIREFNDAFCEDNDLCPICITGGWNCDSDHR